MGLQRRGSKDYLNMFLYEENLKGRRVLPIERRDALPFILNIHYARRIPSISYAYGLLLTES